VLATLRELQDAGIKERPGIVLADAGYWHTVQMENVINHGMQVLIPPDAAGRQGARPGWKAVTTTTCDGCSPATTATISTNDDSR